MTFSLYRNSLYIVRMLTYNFDRLLFFFKLMSIILFHVNVTVKDVVSTQAGESERAQPVH